MNYGKYENLNPAILHEILQYNAIKGPVLDIGCWTGVLGKAIAEHMDCPIDGIDRTIIKSDNCKKYYRKILNFDLNDLDNYPIKGKYQVIVLGDVLEHLMEPEKVLAILQKRMAPDGVIIASIPNISFILNRVTHLFGKWNYKESGILDRTHLRFFTMRTSKELFTNNGFTILKAYGISMVRNRFFFLRFFSKIAPSIFAINSIIVAKNRNN